MESVPECKWVEGDVDPMEDHIKLGYGGLDEPFVVIALVAPGEENVFLVRFLVSREQLEQSKRVIYDNLIRQLDFFLVEKKEPKPWEYAKHHCSTASNLYSDVHWSYYPKGWKGI